jgi:hypothetical protein
MLSRSLGLSREVVHKNVIEGLTRRDERDVYLVAGRPIDAQCREIVGGVSLGEKKCESECWPRREVAYMPRRLERSGEWWNAEKRQGCAECGCKVESRR